MSLRFPASFFSRFTKDKVKKSLLLGGFLIAVFLYGVVTVIAAPPTGGYAPGAEFDPDCLPGETDCFVNLTEVERDAGAPASTPAGQEAILYVNELTGDIYSWDGAAWNSVSALSSITAATATNTIDSDSFAQIWEWDGATTETAMTFRSNSLTTGSLLTLQDDGAALTSGNLFSVLSNSTAFTGSLANITLSGSNAANTGPIFSLTNSGALNTNTSFLIQHDATGTNNLAFRINDIAADTSPFVVDGTGKVGVGIATPLEELHVHDGIILSTPGSPVEVGSLNTAGDLDDVYIVGDLAYLADRTGGLRIVDISNPASPSEIGSVDDGGQALEVVVNGDYAYVADFTDGLEIIDISDPINPVEVGSYTDGLLEGMSLAISGRYLYLAGGDQQLKIIDISDPTNPTLAGSWDDGNGGISYDVIVEGDYVYVADFANGLRILSLSFSGPTSPVNIGTLNDTGTIYKMVKQGNYLYIADSTEGIRIVDVFDPTNPVEVGDYDDGTGNTNGVAISGNYLYVADESDGLEILDVSDPTTPVEVGSFDDGDDVDGVTIVGNYAYLASGGDGLEIVNLNTGVRSPTSEVGTLLADGIETNIFSAQQGYFNTGLNVGARGLYSQGDVYLEGVLGVVENAASAYVGRFFNDGNNANRYGLQVQAGADDGSGTTVYLNALDGNGDQIGHISNTAGTFALTDISDASTKTNIADTATFGLDILNQLRVVDFNRLQDPNGPLITGFIAQEVQEVYPLAVSVGPKRLLRDEEGTPVLDEEGNPKYLPGLLGIQKDAFIPVMVKAFQELDLKVVELEALSGVSSGNSSGVIQIIKDFLANTEEKIVNGILRVRELVVGSEETPTGITLFDTATGSPYCIKVSDGNLVHASGTCAATVLLADPFDENDPEENEEEETEIEEEGSDDTTEETDTTETEEETTETDATSTGSEEGSGTGGDTEQAETETEGAGSESSTEGESETTSSESESSESSESSSESSGGEGSSGGSESGSGSESSGSEGGSSSSESSGTSDSGGSEGGESSGGGKSSSSSGEGQ